MSEASQSFPRTMYLGYATGYVKSVTVNGFCHLRQQFFMLKADGNLHYYSDVPPADTEILALENVREFLNVKQARLADQHQALTERINKLKSATWPRLVVELKYRVEGNPIHDLRVIQAPDSDTACRRMLALHGLSEEKGRWFSIDDTGATPVTNPELSITGLDAWIERHGVMA